MGSVAVGIPEGWKNEDPVGKRMWKGAEDGAMGRGRFKRLSNCDAD